MKLIDDWRRWHRLWSVRIFLALTVMPQAWDRLPHDMRDRLPDDLMPYISGLALLGAVLRIIQQDPKPHADDGGDHG